MTVPSDQRAVAMMGMMLVGMAAASALIGSLGIVNYLNGALLKASGALTLPAFLAYWAWQVRDNLASEPLILGYAGAWLCGLPIGLGAYKLSPLLAWST